MGIASGDTVYVSYVENGTQFTANLDVVAATTVGSLSLGNVAIASGAAGELTGTAATSGFTGGI